MERVKKEAAIVTGASSGIGYAVSEKLSALGYYGLHEELNPDKIKKLVRTNLEAPMILTQQLLRHLKENAGYVINISSV